MNETNTLPAPNAWRMYGPAIAARGWRAIPIHPQSKIPGTWSGIYWFNTPGYQHSGVPSPAMLKAYQSWPSCGIGIVLGTQGDAPGSFVIVVDIDVRVPAVAKEIKKLALRMFGPAPERVGQWPKLALPYRCTEEIAKRTTAGYRMPGDPPPDPVTNKEAPLHRVEILAKPQQVVAYGRHECGRDYSWTGGSPATLAPGELALVTPSVLQHFLEMCGCIMLQAGGIVKAPPSDQDRANGASYEPNPALYAGLRALLDATGRVLGRRQDGRVHIRCPFMDEHPERGDEGTKLLPGGGIKCHHATCGWRTTKDHIIKLKELAAENGMDGTAIYDKAAHPKQLEVARSEFDEIDDATLATLRSAPRPTRTQTEHQRQVRRAARARCKAQAAQAAWERLVEAAQKGQAP